MCLKRESGSTSENKQKKAQKNSWKRNISEKLKKKYRKWLQAELMSLSQLNKVVNLGFQLLNYHASGNDN